MKTIKFFLIIFMIICGVGWQVSISAEEDKESSISDALDSLEKQIKGLMNEYNIDAASVRAQMEQASDNAQQDYQLSQAQEPQAPQNKPIIIDSLELKGMDILDVLKLVSQKSGLNIVAGTDVRGKVTIYLRNVDVWDVLRIILETNNLAYEQVGNIIKVITEKDFEMSYGRKFSDKTQVEIIPLYYASTSDVIPLLTQMKSVVGKVFSDEKSNTIVIIDAPQKLAEMQDFIKTIDAPLSTEVFSLNYAKAEELEPKISNVLTKNVGRVSIDTRTNKMVLRDTPDKLKQAAAVIAAFDERHREVLIEAKIVQVTLSDEFEMGVDWEYLTNSVHELGIESSFSVSPTKYGKISIGTIDPDEYEGFIKALKSIGATNTLSSPHITALNNEEAKILVGTNKPYVTTTTTTPASGPTTTSEAVNFIEVGVKLYVTPTIGKDGFITMKIRPEVSSAATSLTTSQDNQIPIVETSEAETKVMVKDGTTIVIGGLMKDENVKTINKVPFLGDIPLLGLAFQNKTDEVTKTETIIFLTPHIISGDSDSYKVTQMPEFFKEKGY